MGTINETAINATVLDPVCGMEIQPDAAAAIATIDGGRRFYFCSESCYLAFADVPHSYVGWIEAPRGGVVQGHLRDVR